MNITMNIQIRTMDGAIRDMEFKSAKAISIVLKQPEVAKISFDFLGSRLLLYADGTYHIITGD